MVVTEGAGMATVMRTMEARIVPYIEPEEIGGPSEEVGP